MTIDVANGIRRSKFRRAIGLSFFLGMLMFSLEAHAENPAETFVEECIQKGSAILDDKSLGTSERDRVFRDFVLSITDMKRVALFTLGSYAKDAPEADVARFVAAFTELDIVLYRNGFTSYGHSIKITGSTARAEDDVIVNAEAPDSGGKMEPTKLAFRVRKDANGRDIILDVEVSGTWLAIAQSQDFASYLQVSGGDVAKLSHELKTHTAK